MKSVARWSSACLLAAALSLRVAPVFAVEIEGPADRPSATISPVLPAVTPVDAQLSLQGALLPARTADLPQVIQAALPEKTASAASVQARPAESPRAQILQALAPENAGRVSDAQAKDLSAELIEGQAASGGALADRAEPVSAGPALFPGPVFAKASEAREYARRAEPAEPRIRRTASRLKDAVLDRAAYAHIWVDHLYFYLVRNIVNKWGAYQRDRDEAVAKGVSPAVSRPRAFFGHMRTMGQTGRYYPLGFTPRDNEGVMTEARASFRKFFDAPGIGPREYASFENFMKRALYYNAEKRAKSNFVKRLRDKMLEASLLPAGEIAGFFDARVKDDTYIKDFQKQGAGEVLEQFKGVALDLLLKEPARADGKVLGVLLIGSFANGGATPGSDFDVSVITEGGSNARAQAFMKAFIDAWGKDRQKVHTVTFHEAPLRPSRWLIDAIHDCPYLIISPDNQLVEVLQRKPGEAPAFVTSKQLTRRGRLDRVLQYLAVETTMLFTPPAPSKK